MCIRDSFLTDLHVPLDNNQAERDLRRLKFKQKTAYEIRLSLVGSEMCIRDRLCQANAMVGETQAQDLETLPASNGEQLRTRYDTILSKAEAGNPPRPRRPGTRGRVKQSPACNLIRRLRERRNEVLRFLTDRRVPFDNNQAERDLRIPKLKQKAFGCFRSDTGTGDFAIIRSYLSTLRKQSDDLFNSLVLTLQGRPPMPQLE